MDGKELREKGKKKAVRKGSRNNEGEILRYKTTILR
jgi:hypothetical protein